MQKIENRPLSPLEKHKLHENEQKVVQCYERVTKQKFMRFDVKTLKKLIRIAAPEQINAVIFQMHKQYSLNFTYFEYVSQPVERMFKNRRGGSKKSE